MMKNNTQKCNKCNQNFINEEGSNEVICTNCKKKSQKKKYYILALLAFIIASIVLVTWYNTNKSNIVAFQGVGTVNDSISIKVQDTPVFKMDKLIAKKAIVDNVPSSVDNIESFKRWMQQEIKNAEEQNTNSISFPSILLFFEKNSSDISQESKELLAEFEKHYLQTNKEAIIEIEGYTCNLGTDKINNILSQNRAEAVKELFLEYNLPVNLLETKWYGKSKNSFYDYPNQEDYRRVVISIKS